jgi:hypothetical protein
MLLFERTHAHSRCRPEFLFVAKDPFTTDPFPVVKFIINPFRAIISDGNVFKVWGPIGNARHKCEIPLCRTPFIEMKFDCKDSK